MVVSQIKNPTGWFRSYFLLLGLGEGIANLGRGLGDGCGFDAAGERAVGQTSGDLIAGSELRGGADQCAVGVEYEGVAAVEDGERRKRVEARIEGA